MIRRRGARPLRFTGCERARASTGWVPGHPRHDLVIYDTTAGDVVLELRAWPSADAAAEVHAWRAPDRTAALDALHAHDAARDVRVDFDPDDAGFTAAELASRALDLRARIESARRELAALADRLAEADESTT